MEPKSSSDKRFALLIDTDNVSAKYIKPILNELSKYGTVTIKRIYGDWTLTLHAKWKDALLENSLTPIQQFGYTYGKNATDSAMIIDAMDILYGDNVDGFCLVSSDSDFTRLASRLRESGRTVIGMGEKKTPTPFRRACDIFTTLELLLDGRKGERGNGNGAPAISKAEVEQAVVDIITDNQNNGKSTGLGEVGSRLQKRYPDFDVRNYGTNLLSKLLDEFTRVTITKDRSSVTVELTDAHHEAEPEPEVAAEAIVEEAPAEDAPDAGSRRSRRGRGGRRIAARTHAEDEASEEAVAEEAVEEAAEAASAEEPATAEEAEAPRKPTRRGRRGGRRRSGEGEAVPAAAEEPAAKATEAEETETPASAEEPAAAEEAEAPKRKAARRGRPRKAAAEAAPAEAPAAETEAGPAEAPAPAEPTAEKPARKTRSRKAPAKKDAGASAVEEAAKPARATRSRKAAEPANTPAKPAARRGRPRKTPVPVSDAATPEAYIAELVEKAGGAGIGVTQLGGEVRARFKDFKVRDLGFPQMRAYLEGQPGFIVAKEGGAFVVRAR